MNKIIILISLFLNFLFGYVVCLNENNQKSQNLIIPTYSIKLKSDGEYLVYSGNDTLSIAQASYTNEMMSIGWGYISITTNPKYNDSLQIEAAGYLEGYLSYEMIWQNWNNMMVNQNANNSFGNDIISWAKENILYMNQQIQLNQNDPYWINVNLVLQQLNGLTNGYSDANQNPDRQLSLMDFILLNMNVEIYDIMNSLKNNSSSFYQQPNNNSFDNNQHCSALIKLTDDLTELYTGHTTWSDYYQMVRMIKSYNFRFSKLVAAKSNTTMFSGYPGVLMSVDDFYMLDSKLVVLETTNGIKDNDSELFKLIKPQSVLTWIRIIVTNRIAHSGKSWCEIFEKENSGTYNNQWMIVDYNKFIKGVRVQDGTLYVFEQLPGYVEYADVTNILRTGYWPSFNVPYFETISNMSGFNYQSSSSDSSSSSGSIAYEQYPRSQIFRRDSNKVYSISDFQAFMRYNDFQNDPLAYGDPGNQISSRFDLITPQNNASAAGGIDSKVTSLELINQFLMIAQSGPTHDQEPPFSWSSENWKNKYPTIGQPDTFDFEWVTFSTTSFGSFPSASNEKNY
ncbi:phospholipase B-like protein [Dictyostelium discoideum AX4]|uniref:Phospholipase B-like protein C n=1 Tax=Dictyostelium discoideum TaxID=44689 RepID=PLBLC_DICDI|nr:phospholipase B-like protein [Dictyostelium discoideum AX4]Q54M94.1 RecName: Full=Phospholipase B-like protein C; Flags: Precursor [Dictyostelium discoideum]EAL64426.1 phospholipase B-like protein [Dictyostelium discoideum AX4]|eukprot:XP_637940.1 phospholipase B-like protein [Dictyostelium discoideum AX4]